MRKKNRLFALLALLLTVVVAMTALFACVDPNDGDDDENKTTIETKDQLLSNGTFYNATSSTSEKRYVKDTLAGWTKTTGAIGYSSAVMGAIDVAALKENYKLVWDNDAFGNAVAGNSGSDGKFKGAPNTPNEVKEDGTTGPEDEFAAVIATTQNAGSVYYASSSAKIEKNKYYKLSIDVWTYIEKQEGHEGEGAYIFVTDGVYSEWKAINTEGNWETREIYIEGNNFEDRSFSVQLWLGHGPAKIGSEPNPRLTKGVALFDNIILKEIDKEVYQSEASELSGNIVGDDAAKKTSLIYPDPEFDYNRAISSSSSASSTTKSYYSARVGAPYNYTQIVGQTDLTSNKPFVSSSGNSAPYGIFDLSKFYEKTTSEDGKVDWTDTFAKINATEFAAPNYKDFYDTESGKFDNNARKTEQTDYTLDDTRALLIFNNKASGIGYKSDKKLLIETGKYYRVSTYVYVYRALMLPNAIVGSDGTPVKLSEAKMTENENAVATYNINHPQAHIKLTGASLQNAGELEKYTTIDQWAENPLEVVTERVKNDKGEDTDEYTMKVVYNGTEEDASAAREGYWQEVVFYVQGNALSDRKVNVEFWLGEGTKDSETMTAENPDGTLVQGGAIFDSFTILSSENISDFEGHAAEFEELSPFVFEGGNDYADLMNKENNDKITEIEKNKKPDKVNGTANDNRSKDFTLQFAEDVNSADDALKGYVVGPNAENKETLLPGLSEEDFKEWKVTKDGTDSYFNTIVLRNLDYTASLLTVNPTAAIYPNNYYRLSMWVKTSGIEKGQGVTINLIQRNTESDYKTANVLSSFSAVNTEGEWSEYVFYISGNYVDTLDASGAKLDHNEVTVQFVMGTGDSFNTSTHMKGDLIVGALNIQGEITYSEYNSASTGDTLKKYAYSSNILTDNTVTGGRFNTVDYDGTVKAYNEKNLGKAEEDKLEPYDGKGNLSGVGKPSSTSWSQTTPVSNQISAPTSLSVNSEKLTWKGNKDAAYYEIFFKDEKVAHVMPNNADGDEEPSYDMEWTRAFKDSGTFYVRAVPKELSEKLISNKVAQSVTAVANGKPSYEEWKTSDEGTKVPEEAKNLSYNFGIVDYKNLSEKNIKDIIGDVNTTGLDADSFKNLYAPTNETDRYGAKDVNDIRYFYGEEGMLPELYNNVLMLSSQYKTRGGYTMYSSTSLSSESYYLISVWVKTLGEATASFTIDNSTNTFYNTAGTKYIGFNNVKTDGEWVQLQLLAKTGLSSATLKLKLFMGDPYAEDYKDGEGLCAGTVFFDDIVLKKLDGKEAYEKLANKGDGEFEDGAYDYKGDGEFFKNGKLAEGVNVFTDLEFERNAYAFKTLEFSIDSFDVTTESTATATGAKPDDYTQTIVGENTTVSNASDAKVAYGVYNVSELDDEKHVYLYENFKVDGNTPDWFGIDSIEGLKSFMQGFGDNVLVMANFIDNGMYYKSSTKTIKASSYYQISFYAKLKAEGENYAEMRFYHGDDTKKYEAIKINGSGDPAADYGFKKYTLYVHNETSSSVSSNYITFNLGTKDTTDTDTTVTNFFKGMLIIDNVQISETDEETYTKMMSDSKYEEWSDDQKKTSSELVNFTKFSASDDGSNEPTETEKKGWDSTTWLIFSTSMIGAMIVVAVAVVLIRNFRKKHIKTKAPEIESNVKVDGYVSEKKEQKKDADRREFDD